jgi:hypothetical protein
VAGGEPWPGRSDPFGTLGGPGVGNDGWALADLARRLQERVDDQEALLDRAADLALDPHDRARLEQAREAARRLRRDSEVLLLMCGAEPAGPDSPPQAVADVLEDAVGSVEEPSRVALWSVPEAELAPAAAVELGHLVAELVDEATAASPGSRIEVRAHLEPDGGLRVDVVVAGRGWTDVVGAVGGSRIAEALARRCTGGIRLDRPAFDDAPGLVAILRCPALRTADPGLLSGEPWVRVPAPTESPSFPVPAVPAVSAASWSGMDELFGPLPVTVGAVGTPIFEAVASAWFRDAGRELGAYDWDSPGDREWRAAAERAMRSETATVTASGLPRRNPGDRLVPPPRGAQAPLTAPEERVPERVRDRLATYQRGLRQGRHRAVDPAPGGSAEAEADAWSAEGW